MTASNLSSGQFQQLDMFKPAKELRSMPLGDVKAEIWNAGGGESYQPVAKRVMARKVRQAKRSGLYLSIKREGVQKPVTVAHQVVGKTFRPAEVHEGHHRIASAMAINPNMLIPVQHEVWS